VGVAFAERVRLHRETFARNYVKQYLNELGSKNHKSFIPFSALLHIGPH